MRMIVMLFVICGCADQPIKSPARTFQCANYVEEDWNILDKRASAPFCHSNHP